MQGYPTIVRTGRHDLDVQAVEKHRREAAAQGIVLIVEPLPGGGFQLSAAPPSADGVGATMPSNQTPIRPSTATPVPAAAAEAPLGDPSGTLPSRFASYPYARPTGAPQVEVILRPGEGYCEACHRVGPLRQARFMQNIGAVVLRFPRTVSGQLCKHCIDKFFFRFTAVTLLLGWWGIVSFFYSCVSIPSNVIQWLGSIGMVAPPDDVASLREKRARGSAGVAVGALVASLALLTLAFGALLASTGSEGSVVALVVIGSSMGVVAAVILFFGIRARMRAGAGLRRLGAVR